MNHYIYSMVVTWILFMLLLVSKWSHEANDTRMSKYEHLNKPLRRVSTWTCAAVLEQMSIDGFLFIIIQQSGNEHLCVSNMAGSFKTDYKWS